MKFDFHPVTSERWSDFEELFECKGGPHNCWCMVWRINENRWAMPGKSGKKASMKNRVEQGIPIGLLAEMKPSKAYGRLPVFSSSVNSEKLA